MSLYQTALETLRTCHPADRAHHVNALLEHINEEPAPRDLNHVEKTTVADLRAEIVALQSDPTQNDAVIQANIRAIRRIEGNRILGN
jgi:hypothetical protein